MTLPAFAAVHRTAAPLLLSYGRAAIDRYLVAAGRGVRTGGAGSAAAPPTFGAGEQCSPGSLSMWQTDGDYYLQVEVTSISLFLLCTN